MRTVAALVVILAIVATAGGCISTRGPKGPCRELRQQQRVARCEPEMELTVGRLVVGLARWAASHDEQAAEAFPRGLRRVSVGVYRLEPTPAGRPGLLAARDFPSWMPLVEVGGEESVLVLSRGLPMRRMLVVVQEGTELVVVDLRGRLDEMVEEVMRFAFAQAERPELAEPAVEDLRARPGAAAGTAAALSAPLRTAHPSPAGLRPPC
jgi:hypothetical protein